MLRLSVAEPAGACSADPACVLAGRGGPHSRLVLGSNVLVRPPNASAWGKSDAAVPVYDVVCSAGCAAKPGALQLRLKDCGRQGDNPAAVRLGVGAFVEYVDVVVHAVDGATRTPGFTGTLGLSGLVCGVSIARFIAKRVLRKAYGAAP